MYYKFIKLLHDRYITHIVVIIISDCNMHKYLMNPFSGIVHFNTLNCCRIDVYSMLYTQSKYITYITNIYTCNKLILKRIHSGLFTYWLFAIWFWFVDFTWLSSQCKSIDLKISTTKRKRKKTTKVASNLQHIHTLYMYHTKWLHMRKDQMLNPFWK